MKILIVEDEFLIAQMLLSFFHGEGFAVCGPVGKGEEAVDMARAENPDIVLMDIRLMGIVDGIEAARRIAEFSDASIIFTTGYSDPGIEKEAMALHPAAFLIKPVDPGEVIRLIQAVRPR